MTIVTEASHLVELAARNNALWCDQVCRAHGRPGEFQEGIWLNRRGTPRFYPDAVTLAGPDAGSQQLQAISALLEARRAGVLTVKDSFSCLNLDSLGFKPLIEAEWISLSASAFVSYPATGGYSWIDIRSVSELTAWESAWLGKDDQTEIKPDERIFQASLLTHQEIHFIAITRDDRIVGGGILNQGSGVIGVSNVFVRDCDPEMIWQSLVALAGEAFPDMPLVGYESERDLTPALRSGFRTLGPLRVWLSAG